MPWVGAGAIPKFPATSSRLAARGFHYRNDRTAPLLRLMDEMGLVSCGEQQNKTRPERGAPPTLAARGRTSKKLKMIKTCIKLFFF